MLNCRIMEINKIKEIMRIGIPESPLYRRQKAQCVYNYFSLRRFFFHLCKQQPSSNFQNFVLGVSQGSSFSSRSPINSMASLGSDVNMIPAGEASGNAASSSTKKAKRFEVKKWSAVALWAWGKPRNPYTLLNSSLDFGNRGLLIDLWFVVDIVVDNCAICRNHIMDLCKCL